jgi:hypothetical protein
MKKTRTLVQQQDGLHHENMPAHTSQKTTEFVTNNNMVIIPHPSYSPDLAPRDSALFPKLKMKVKGWCFETVSDIQRELQAVLDSISIFDLVQELSVCLLVNQPPYFVCFSLWYLCYIVTDSHHQHGPAANVSHVISVPPTIPWTFLMAH